MKSWVCIKAKGYGYKNVGFILDRGYFSKQNIVHTDVWADSGFMEKPSNAGCTARIPRNDIFISITAYQKKPRYKSENFDTWVICTMARESYTTSIMTN